MQPRDVALHFLRYFTAGHVQELAPLIADDLRVWGTLYEYDSGAEYLKALERDPPEPGDLQLLSVTEDRNEVAVFYDYEKTRAKLRIAQLFRISGGLIREMYLVFDGRPFV